MSTTSTLTNRTEPEPSTAEVRTARRAKEEVRPDQLLPPEPEHQVGWLTVAMSSHLCRRGNADQGRGRVMLTSRQS